MERNYVNFRFLLLIAGVILTVITMLRMRSGRIGLPGWAKALLSVGAILTVVITLLGMLPPIEAEAINPFEHTSVDIATPVVPSETIGDAP